ncbi:40S ribosomal protein S29-like isoform X2 [Octopus sinensis]|uniref:Small ribosomal subunit protein uS14 n=1 Tax=Octopus sinensis TaxID=2607531 RepID=A0A7E6EU85_9MOLL|nr:40S ribosomal protein S29-like isoform X2 [Octopus sinensis]
MGHTTLWFSHPRRFGPGSRQCRVCANTHGVIRKYSLFMCRRCFREYSNDIGFKKVREFMSLNLIFRYSEDISSKHYLTI